ncbi:MAG: iron-sulfur cluster assembly accessory protein [Symbiobacterium sp.]|jgi:Iron-sulphur cluster biosynthesis.|uniref:HesB/IscA family protein n=1 Tax=Symbiobacterium sp. TaxID=1971213 RepID=UPI003464E1B5
MRLASTAVLQIRRLTATAQRPDCSLRIAPQPGGCCGQFLYMSLDVPQEGDLVVRQDGVAVYVAPALAEVVEGAVLEYNDRLRPPRFRFRRLNAQHRCACGRSFGAPFVGKSRQCRAYELPPWLEGA